jgi:Protein of unknown function (DUF3500)
VFHFRGALVAGAAALLFVATMDSSPAPSRAEVTAARVFLDSLRPALREEASLAFSDPDRLDWSYVPGRRRGVSLNEMNATERSAAYALVKSTLSERGYAKATGVVELEGILREIETFGWSRDPGRYWLAVFGRPSESATWGWRFEGHHLSLNFTSSSNNVVACTPAFFGANPARVPAGRPRAGWRVLAAEEDLARQLLASLTPAGRARAVISSDAPGDIVLSPGRRNPPAIEGLPASDMTAAQREILVALVGEYVRNARADVAETRWKEIEAAGLTNLRFAWAGGTRPGEGHYYRVQGPTFAMEYDNTQNRANHVHSVWRDFRNDFGADLLRRHYEESPHHADARRRSGEGRNPKVRPAR